MKCAKAVDNPGGSETVLDNSSNDGDDNNGTTGDGDSDHEVVDGGRTVDVTSEHVAALQNEDTAIQVAGPENAAQSNLPEFDFTRQYVEQYLLQPSGYRGRSEPRADAVRMVMPEDYDPERCACYFSGEQCRILLIDVALHVDALAPYPNGMPGWTLFCTECFEAHPNYDHGPRVGNLVEEGLYQGTYNRIASQCHCECMTCELAVEWATGLDWLGLVWPGMARSGLV